MIIYLLYLILNKKSLSLHIKHEEILFLYISLQFFPSLVTDPYNRSRVWPRRIAPVMRWQKVHWRTDKTILLTTGSSPFCVWKSFQLVQKSETAHCTQTLGQLKQRKTRFSVVLVCSFYTLCNLVKIRSCWKVVSIQKEKKCNHKLFWAEPEIRR